MNDTLFEFNIRMRQHWTGNIQYWHHPTVQQRTVPGNKEPECPPTCRWRGTFRYWLGGVGNNWFTVAKSLEYRLYGVIPLHISRSYLPLICLSTNQNIQLIQSLLIRIEWSTGNGILMSSSHWPIYNKLYPDYIPNSFVFNARCPVPV